MNPYSQPLVKHLSEYVKNLHNQQETVVSSELKQSIELSKLDATLLDLLNLEVTHSVKRLPTRQPQYFQQQQFIIPSTINKIGHIIRAISPLCEFSSQKQQLLSEFSTTAFYQQFYQQCQQNQQSTLLVDFTKGLFPLINVHKDNIPLFMPFYHRIQSYNEFKIGNPNWEMSRRNFSYIYKSEVCFGVEGKEEEWYLMLMGDRRLVGRYGGRRLERVWAWLYCYYTQETLKPYRTVEETTLEEDITVQNIIKVVNEVALTETDQLTKLLLQVILYSLTQTHQQLQKITNMLSSLVQSKLSALGTISATPEQVSIYGLMSTILCRLVHNLLQLQQGKEMHDQLTLNSLKEQLSLIMKTTNSLVSKRIPFHDFYLRIAYPSYTTDTQKAQANQTKILQLLQQQLAKDSQQQSTTSSIYPFPQYIYFQRQFNQQFSKTYLQKHPSQIVSIAQFLPAQISIWRLLNSQKLSHKESFLKIHEILINHKQEFIEVLKKKITQLSEQDYDKFVTGWKTYYETFRKDGLTGDQLNVQQFEHKLQRCKQTVKQLSKTVLIEEFRLHVYWVMDKGENRMKLMDYMIEGFEEVSQVVDEQDREKLLRQYLAFLLDPVFKTEIFSKMTEEEKDEFWKKWVLVYMGDDQLVTDLVGQEERKIEEKSMRLGGNGVRDGQKTGRIEQKRGGQSQKQVVVMELQ